MLGSILTPGKKGWVNYEDTKNYDTDGDAGGVLCGHGDGFVRTPNHRWRAVRCRRDLQGKVRCVPRPDLQRSSTRQSMLISADRAQGKEGGKAAAHAGYEIRHHLGPGQRAGRLHEID